MELIIHNSVSLDGSLTNFEVEMGLHYELAGRYEPDIHLVGSNTARAGMEMYGPVPREREEDLAKPNRSADLPYWVIPDTRGILKGMLHACRAFEYCRDVIVLVSEKTPEEYLTHLDERQYDHHVVGTDHVDLPEALEFLESKYGARRILTDTGRVLGNLLLEQGLVSEVSLLIHPVLVGAASYPIFGALVSKIELRLIGSEAFENGCVWGRYGIADPVGSGDVGEHAEDQ